MPHDYFDAKKKYKAILHGACPYCKSDNPELPYMRNKEEIMVYCEKCGRQYWIVAKYRGVKNGKRVRPKGWKI